MSFVLCVEGLKPESEKTIQRSTVMIPKNLDTRKIAVIILKFEACGFTIE